MTKQELDNILQAKSKSILDQNRRYVAMRTHGVVLPENSDYFETMQLYLLQKVAIANRDTKPDQQIQLPWYINPSYFLMMTLQFQNP